MEIQTSVQIDATNCVPKMQNGNNHIRNRQLYTIGVYWEVSGIVLGTFLKVRTVGR